MFLEFFAFLKTIDWIIEWVLPIVVVLLCLIVAGMLYLIDKLFGKKKKKDSKDI